MKVKMLNDASQRIYAVIFETGEDPVAGLTRFAEEQDLTASSFTAHRRVQRGAARLSARCVPRSKWC